MTQSWQSRRSALNHDWLRSALEAEFGKWGNIIAGRIESDSSVARFRTAVLDQWTERSPHIKQLVEDIETEMSPARLLTDDRAFRNPDYIWLRGLAVNLWKVRCQIGLKVERVLRSLAATKDQSRILEAVLDCLPEDSSVVGIESIRVELTKFRLACRDLSDAIHDLPSSILVA
jgi:hypothetical protein